MARSVDRLGRSLQDLIGFLSELHALHIDLFLHQQGLDTTTPSGKAMFQMMGVFAEFERAMIQEVSVLALPEPALKEPRAASPSGCDEPRQCIGGLRADSRALNHAPKRDCRPKAARNQRKDNLYHPLVLARLDLKCLCYTT